MGSVCVSVPVHICVCSAHAPALIQHSLSAAPGCRVVLSPVKCCFRAGHARGLMTSRQKNFLLSVSIASANGRSALWGGGRGGGKEKKTACTSRTAAVSPGMLTFRDLPKSDWNRDLLVDLAAVSLGWALQGVLSRFKGCCVSA